MNKKKYFTLDAIRFSFKTFRKHSFSLLTLSILVGLFLWGVISIVYIIKWGSVTHTDFAILFNTFRSLTSGEFAFLLQPILLDDLIRICTAAFLLILIGISEIIAIKAAVMLYDNEPITFKNIFTFSKKIPTYFTLAFLLFYVSNLAADYIIGCGFLMEALCRLYKYFLIDKNTNISQAFIRSWKISKNHLIDLSMAWAIMIFVVVISSTLASIFCLSIMNSLAIFIIACYTTFTCLFINACVYAFFYRKLLEEKQMLLTPANVIIENNNRQQKTEINTLQT